MHEVTIRGPMFPTFFAGASGVLNPRASVSTSSRETCNGTQLHPQAPPLGPRHVAIWVASTASGASSSGYAGEGGLIARRTRRSERKGSLIHFATDLWSAKPKFAESEGECTPLRCYSMRVCGFHLSPSSVMKQTQVSPFASNGFLRSDRSLLLRVGVPCGGVRDSQSFSTK